MPVFVIKAKDRLAVAAVQGYRERCLEAGLDHQADEVAKALDEIRDWQRRNPGLVQAPDHDHVPAGRTPSAVRMRCLEFALSLTGAGASAGADRKAGVAVENAKIFESYILGSPE